MEKRLTYKIGEKYAMLFLQKSIEDFKVGLESIMERFAEDMLAWLDKLMDSISEISGNHIKTQKLKRPPKKILPTKSAPAYRIMPHARSRC